MEGNLVFKTSTEGAGDMTELEKCLPCKLEDLSLVLSTIEKLDLVAYTCNLMLEKWRQSVTSLMIVA